MVKKVKRLHGVIHSLASVIHRMFLYENIDDIIMEANNLDEETSDANSVQNNSPVVNPRSSGGSHQIDENKEGKRTARSHTFNRVSQGTYYLLGCLLLGQCLERSVAWVICFWTN